MVHIKYKHFFRQKNHKLHKIPSIFAMRPNALSLGACKVPSVHQKQLDCHCSHGPFALLLMNQDESVVKYSTEILQLHPPPRHPINHRIPWSTHTVHLAFVTVLSQ